MMSSIIYFVLTVIGLGFGLSKLISYYDSLPVTSQKLYPECHSCIYKLRNKRCPVECKGDLK